MESCLFYRHVSDMHLIVHVSNGYSSLNLSKERHLSHNTEDWMQKHRKCSTADK